MEFNLISRKSLNAHFLFTKARISGSTYLSLFFGPILDISPNLHYRILSSFLEKRLNMPKIKVSPQNMF